ncbi:MAG: type II toxin-antitoxin system RelE/ParE family toxin [Acidobacteria bacterium]|nr:type II toxin-antitoxin system RelE/ParE family toxin [Acidobacteriota bacterium]
MEVIVHPKVDDDLVDHIEYYSREGGSELGLEFYNEFLRCYYIIVERAASFPLYTPRLRRINFNRFPYHILFEVLGDEVIHVVVVKHDSRDPDFGLDR